MKHLFEQPTPRGSHSPTKMNRATAMRRGLALALTLLLAGPSGATAAGPPQGPPPAVRIAKIAEQDVNPPAEFVGHMEAMRSVALQARVTGFLDKVHFQDGAHVKADEVMYTIEQAPYEAQVNVDKAGVAKAKAALAKAEQYWRRLQSAGAGAVSASDKETATSEALQARAALQVAEATLAQSEISLSYTIIRTPISGVIGKTAYTEGNLVNLSSGTLAKVVQLDPIRVVFSISENQLPGMREKGASGLVEQLRHSRVIRLKLADGSIYPKAGRFAFMDNEVDSSTGTIALYADFDNPDDDLLPGQYVYVQLSLSEPKMMPVVPKSAVLEDKDGHYVFVIDKDNTAQPRRIKTGAELETVWSVTEGLAVGDTIIVEGLQKVRPGQPVRPLTGSDQ